MKNKKLLLIMLVLAITCLAIACGKSDSKQESSGNSGKKEEKTKIVVGCMAREEPDILYAAEALKDTKYEIVPKVFSDVITANMATQDGEIDANFTQNKKYLESFNESNHTTLVAPGEAISTFPEGLYSRKYSTLEELPDEAIIAIANDPVNRTRELNMLEACGLIKLDKSVENPTSLNIIENKKKIQILEMDSRAKWGAYDDVDCIVCTAVTIFMSDDPKKPSHLLAIEGMDVTMTVAGTCLVVAEENQDAEWLKLMNDAMHTDDYAKHLAETYKGAKVPMFKTDSFEVNYFGK